MSNLDQAKLKAMAAELAKSVKLKPTYLNCSVCWLK